MNGWFPLAVLILIGAEDFGPREDVADQVRRLNGQVVPLGSETVKSLAQMMSRDVRRRLQVANQRETKAWRERHNRADWERFRDVRLKALRASLGQFSPTPRNLNVRVTGTLQGNGYRIDNLVFESRPGFLVTANLY